MIQTKFPITIEIDEKSFSIVVLEYMTHEKKDELKAIQEKHSDSFKKKDEIQLKLNEALEEFEINKHILAHGSVAQKLKVMFEQKSLNAEIFTYQKEMKKIDENITSLLTVMDELFEKRYDILVTGADKLTLKKEIDLLGISYQTLFTEFGARIKEVKEKK